MKTIDSEKKPILIALMQWFVTSVLQVDRLFFSYDSESIYFVLTKALYLLLLLVAWDFIFYAKRKIEEGDTRWIRGRFIFIVYCLIVMAFLLICWPGTWSWDDLWTINNLWWYGSWNAWQHTLTGAYQDVFLQILPFPGGIILIQNVIISLCVAFIIVKVELIFGIKPLRNIAIDTVVKLIPFLLPPVLMYQYSGYRMGLYVYLEAVMLVILLGAFKDREKWSIRYTMLFITLCIIVSVWRTESLFYVPFACLLLLFISKSVIANRNKIICIGLIIIGFIGLTKFQNWALGDANYQIASILGPCAAAVRSADQIEDAEELAKIDKVTDISVILRDPNANGESLYWASGCVRNRNDIEGDEWTDEEYSEFMKAFIKLSFKYPKAVIEERWNLYIQATGITGNTATNVWGAATLFDAGNDNSAADATFGHSWIAVKPVFKNLRRKFIKLIGMDFPGGKMVKTIRILIWNAIIPELMLLVSWIVSIIRKKWYLFGVLTAVLVRLPLVILTQPTNWIMYQLSFYLLGYIVLVFGVLGLLSRKKEKSLENA